LLSGVADMVAAIADERGLLIALDDLHWADAASLDMLAYLIRAHGQARLLVVGAFRAGEAATNPALERTLVELNHLRVLTTLPLGPLNLEAVGALAGVQLQGRTSPALDRVLFNQSEGNPFFAEEILRDWSEMGHLERVYSGSEMWRLIVPSPPSIPATLPRRFGNAWRGSRPRQSTSCGSHPLWAGIRFRRAGKPRVRRPRAGGASPGRCGACPYPARRRRQRLSLRP
jgi:hypothetical protein